MLAREIHHLCHLGLGDFIGEYAALPDTVMMNVQHDLGRGLDILLKEFFEHVNDEFHRRVVVVQDQDAIEIGSLGLRLDLGDDGGNGTAASACAVFVIAHSGIGYGNRRHVRIGSGHQAWHGTGVRNPKESVERRAVDALSRRSTRTPFQIAVPA